ncbi:MAG TPA: hypothetical protein VE545_03380 [Candidatus Dormibacteraeota bacterium]|nr:hypothetical protein [Candidatus Dormibacteraeota bacterium]
MPTINPDLIVELSSEDELARVIAAEQIHREGSAPALRVINAWRQHRELAALLPRPETTVTVGVAVQPDTFAKIHAAIGAPELAEVPPDQDAKEFELIFDNGVLLDILTTKDPAGSGAIARYLSKFGEGIQQVEFECADVDLATELLKQLAAQTPVYPRARPGANNTRINFYLVNIAGRQGPEKLLIELFERPSTTAAH